MVTTLRVLASMAEFKSSLYGECWGLIISERTFFWLGQRLQAAPLLTNQEPQQSPSSDLVTPPLVRTTQLNAALACFLLARPVKVSAAQEMWPSYRRRKKRQEESCVTRSSKTRWDGESCGLWSFSDFNGELFITNIQALRFWRIAQFRLSFADEKIWGPGNSNFLNGTQLPKKQYSL